MNLPNTITICRLLLIPVFLILWWTEFYLSATAVFFIASATDILDGHLARSRNEETKLGALLDPLVDKILVTTGFIMLVEMGKIPAWAVVLILTREFLVTGLRTILIDKGVVLRAGLSGKLKTFLQIASITFIYLSLSLEQHHNSYSVLVKDIGYGIFWVAFIVTLISGVLYAWRGKKLLEEPSSASVPEAISKKNPETVSEEEKVANK